MIPNEQEQHGYNQADRETKYFRKLDKSAFYLDYPVCSYYTHSRFVVELLVCSYHSKLYSLFGLRVELGPITRLADSPLVHVAPYAIRIADIRPN